MSVEAGGWGVGNIVLASVVGDAAAAAGTSADVASSSSFWVFFFLPGIAKCFGRHAYSRV